MLAQVHGRRLTVHQYSAKAILIDWGDLDGRHLLLLSVIGLNLQVSLSLTQPRFDIFERPEPKILRQFLNQLLEFCLLLLLLGQVRVWLFFTRCLEFPSLFTVVEKDEAYLR